MEVKLQRKELPQFLTRREAVWDRGAALKHRLQKIFLSPLPRIKFPFLDQPAIHFATTLTELINSYYKKASQIINYNFSGLNFYVTTEEHFFHMEL